MMLRHHFQGPRALSAARALGRSRQLKAEEPEASPFSPLGKGGLQKGSRARGHLTSRRGPFVEETDSQEAMQDPRPSPCLPAPEAATWGPLSSANSSHRQMLTCGRGWD